VKSSKAIDKLYSEISIATPSTWVSATVDDSKYDDVVFEELKKHCVWKAL